jgi:hypothetical protein
MNNSISARTIICPNGLEVTGPITAPTIPSYRATNLSTRISPNGGALHVNGSTDACGNLSFTGAFSFTGNARIVHPSTGTYDYRINMTYQGSSGNYNQDQYVEMFVSDQNTVWGRTRFTSTCPANYLNPITLSVEVPITSSNINTVYLGFINQSGQNVTSYFTPSSIRKISNT